MKLNMQSSFVYSLVLVTMVMLLGACAPTAPSAPAADLPAAESMPAAASIASAVNADGTCDT